MKIMIVCDIFCILCILPFIEILVETFIKCANVIFKQIKVHQHLPECIRVEAKIAVTV